MSSKRERKVVNKILIYIPHLSYISILSICFFTYTHQMCFFIS